MIALLTLLPMRKFKNINEEIICAIVPSLCLVNLQTKPIKSAALRSEY